MQQPNLQVLEPKLAQALRDSPLSVPWLRRDTLVDELHRVGVPRPRSERWKYQNPRALVDAFLVPSSCHADIEGENIHVTPLNDLQKDLRPGVEKGLMTTYQQSSLALLNGILFSEGWFIEVLAGKNAEMHLTGTTDSIESLCVSVEKDANLKVLDDSSGGSQTIYYDVAPGAHLEVIRLQPHGCLTESREVRILLHEEAVLDYRGYGLGAGLRSNEVVVDCKGNGAKANISGVWRTRDKEDMNQRFTVNHLVPDCASEQAFRAILVDESRSVFNARIYINTGARKTEAHLVCRSVTLGELAEAYAKPELVIHNDDVICSHGVTAGPLDPDVSFYLQSRGIPLQAAEEILIKGFLRELAPDESGRELLHLN